MDIKKAIEKVFGPTKTAPSNRVNATSSEQLESLKKVLETLEIQSSPQPQPPSAYESRRSSIEESSEPIEGIFFIIDEKLVPDYYSECLFSEVDANPVSSKNKQHPRKCMMYHEYFFDHYISGKYKGIGCPAKATPRGRVQKEPSDKKKILIDGCYFNDGNMIKQVIELYRLSGEISVTTSSEYRCAVCVCMGRGDKLGFKKYEVIVE